jgi:hypothetical protein
MQAPGAITVGVLMALATAWVGGWTLVKLREWNAWLARRKRSALEHGSRGAVVGLQLAGLTSDLARAFLLTALGYGLLFPLARAMVALWSFDGMLSRAVTVGAACAVAAAAAWTIFHSARGARWYFAAGLLVGFLLLTMR